MKRQDYIKATQAAIINQPKYWAKHHNDRVTADGGTVTDETPVGQRSHLTDYYKFLRESRLIDNLVFSWDSSSGIKERTSGVNTYAAKAYDMSSGNRDAVQATEANQPFVGGGIAPSEKRRVTSLQDNKVLSHTTITIDSTGTNGFAITTVLKPTFENVGVSSNKGLYLNGMFINITTTSIGIFNATTGSILWALALNNTIGKNKIITITANSSGIFCYVDGVLIPITSGSYTPFSSYLSGLFNNSANDTFAGSIYHHQIFNKTLSASEVQAQHAYLRLQHPEIEGINIGNQHWATSNYEGVVTGNGTVIPEVQGASTAANPELVVNGNFIDSNSDGLADNWIKSGITTPTTTIVVGNGFAGNAQRVELASAYSRLYQAVSFSKTKAYLVTFKYRSSSTLRYSIDGNSSKFINTPANTGDAIVVSANVVFYGLGLGQILFQQESSTDAWFEVGEISVKEVGWADLTTPAWCYYDNNQLNGAVYGKLYNWYAVQAIAANPPSGWRVPTPADFTQLSTFLGGAAVAGGKLKKEGFTYWNSPNTGATNESGFSVIGTGRRDADGSYKPVKEYSGLWTSESLRLALLSANNAQIELTQRGNERGYSLRLIRNEPVGATERIIETGYITNALGATNLDISIPFGYQVESIRFDSETNITGLSAKLYTGALVELETLFTAKSVTANVQKVIAADADQSIQQTDAVVRINGTKADTASRFRVWIKLTKVVFS